MGIRWYVVLVCGYVIPCDIHVLFIGFVALQCSLQVRNQSLQQTAIASSVARAAAVYMVLGARVTVRDTSDSTMSSFYAYVCFELITRMKRFSITFLVETRVRWVRHRRWPKLKKPKNESFVEHQVLLFIVYSNTKPDHRICLSLSIVAYTDTMKLFPKSKRFSG